MIINQSIHVYAEDKIEAKASEDFNWVKIGDTSLFAGEADLTRIRDAINACILDMLARQAKAA